MIVLLAGGAGGEPGPAAEGVGGGVQQAEHPQHHQAHQHQHGCGTCHSMSRQAQTLSRAACMLVITAWPWHTV